ncbi:MAG: hypothetical protein ACYDH9_20205 [Limisphaerales bacterium]
MTKVRNPIIMIFLIVALLTCVVVLLFAARSSPPTVPTGSAPRTQSSLPAAATTAWNTYANTTYGISLMYPENWRVFGNTTSTGVGPHLSSDIIAGFLPPDNRDSEGEVVARAYYAKYFDPRGTLEGFLAAKDKDNSYTNDTPSPQYIAPIITTNAVTIGGLPGVEREERYWGGPYPTIATYVERDGVVYSIEMQTALTHGAVDRDTYEKIVSSFRFTAPGRSASE